MSRWRRWAWFNAIGVTGMMVQLGALSLFQRAGIGHFVLAIAAAVELALLHNFAWHWHFTWRDCRDATSPMRRLLRFHLSNGSISILGNVAVLQLLVVRAHWPVLPSNFAAIVGCSVANYVVADRWTFARPKAQDELPE